MIDNNLTKLNNLLKNYNFSSVVHTDLPNMHIFKGESGATNHYLSPLVSNTLKNIHLNRNINVTVPDNTNISSTHTGQLNIPMLTDKATAAHILPDLKNTSLISSGQLADDGCNILLNKHTMNVFKYFDLIYWKVLEIDMMVFGR